MPRAVRDQITKSGMATASDHSASFTRRALDARGEHEQETAEERDRGGRVTRREARVDREGLEPVDVRSVAVDDEGRDAIRPGLDADHEQRESRESPVAEREKAHEEHADDDRNDDAARQRRADPRQIDASRGCGRERASG